MQFLNNPDFKKYILPNLNYKKTVYAYFPFHYHIIPGYFRNFLYKKLNINNFTLKNLNKNKFKLNNSHLIQNQENKLIINIDVDSYNGYKNLDKFSIFLKNQNDCKTIIFIPSNGFNYSEQHLLNLIKDGFEIGCHGYNHNGKLPFYNFQKMESFFECINIYNKKFNITKFKSPAYIHTLNSIYFTMKYFKEDWSFRDIYFIKNKFFGTFNSNKIVINNFNFRFINNLEDVFYLNLNLNKKEIIKIIIDKILYLKNNNITPILTFHPESHFSGNKKIFELFKSIIFESLNCLNI